MPYDMLVKDFGLVTLACTAVRKNRRKHLLQLLVGFITFFLGAEATHLLSS